jgi:hypothetical protein
MKPHGILVNISIKAGALKVNQIPTVQKLKENELVCYVPFQLKV